MKKVCLMGVMFLSLHIAKGQNMRTRWADNAGHHEYPRPQMVRSNWVNLNGAWDYAIADQQPARYDGKINVPFPIESQLSGVKKALQPDELLWYRRTFTRPSGERILLHFGAVDNECWIFVNGKEAGHHAGGYTAFCFDITSMLKAGKNELIVKVSDPTDRGVYPHGKQVLRPESIYYTASSGIWQTVWMEAVPAAYIESLYITPDLDKGMVNVKVNAPAGYSVALSADGQSASGKTGSPIELKVKNIHPWSPQDPYLYDLKIQLKKGNKVVDEVSSYFGMRKISIANERICLNNKPYFNLGTLDQGFWPDGLYTAPNDDALAFDIKAIKAMGFNTIRKHIKIEPARWYYHADKLGMLVWQDFVNPNQGLPEGSKPAFEAQGKEMLAQLYNYPCITTWVLFNEKWGQYDQQRLTEWTKQTDPSRLVNGHSGEFLYVNEQLRSPSPNAYVSADMTDVHAYPDPMISIHQPGKARVVGEFGGIGVFIPDHQWNTGSAWGYINEKPASLKAKYTIMNQHLQILEKQGLSASIYTQPFDVEGEQNGLMTYDRAVIKIPFEDLRKIHAPLNPGMGSIPEVTAVDADLTEPGIRYSQLLQQYMDGNRDVIFLHKLVITATQVGDKTGAALAGEDYIATMKAPLSEENVRSIVQLTKSTSDKGFTLMHEQAEQFRKVLGDRPYTVAMMNMIFRGELEPMLQNTDQPDWEAMHIKASRFGEPGEEMWLRAKVIHLLNHQSWEDYVPAATEYLQKYGANVPENERKMLEEQVTLHGGKL